MARLPKPLRGDFGYAREYSDSTGFTTYTISVSDIDQAIAVATEWGETLPYSSYRGFFRFVAVTTEEGVTSRSVTPIMPTLAESVTFLYQSSIRFQNPDYDQVIALQVVVEIPRAEWNPEEHPRDKRGRFKRAAKWNPEDHPRRKDGRFKRRMK